jgi:ferredoxin/flavodoxin---NADP+ reductase
LRVSFDKQRFHFPSFFPSFAIEVDDVIINYGSVSSLGPIKTWNLEIEKNAIVVNSKQETNIPGIYAAGDI